MIKFNSELVDEVVGGGGQLSEKYLSENSVELNLKNITDEVDRNIAILSALHPNLLVRFRDNDLSLLSKDDKKVLLRGMYQILGIKPLNDKR